MMIRLVLSTFIMGLALPSYANVTACKTKLAAQTPNTEVSELDALVAELTAEKNAPTANPEIIADAPNADVVSQDPRSMNLSELLASLQLQPYQARLAAAEIVRQNQNGGQGQLKEEVQSLFEAITSDELTERQKLHLPSYKKVLEQLIGQSKAVRRYEIMNHYDDLNGPSTVADLFVSAPITAPAPVAEPGFFARLFGGNKKEDVLPVVHIPYENPEQYSRALLERPSAERVEIIRNQSKKIGLLSHLEIYRILMTIAPESQVKVYEMLKPNLIGRIDFYPLEVLRISADVDSVAALDVVPVRPEIILKDLKETGKNLDIFEVYNFLKILDFKSSDISTAMIGRKLSYEQLSKFAEEQGQSIPFDDMLAFGRIFIHSSSDIGTIEKGRSFLKSVFPDPDLATAIDHYFDREIRETKFRVQQMIAKIQPESLKPQELYEKLSLMIDELQYVKPEEAIMFLSLIPSEAFYVAEGPAIALMPKTNIDFFLDFREGIRQSPFHDDRKKKWTASDLPFLHVSKNLDLAHEILTKVQGSMTEELRSQIGAEVLRQINKSHLYEPKEGELNPLKVDTLVPVNTMRPVRDRGVSAAALKEYLFYRVANL